MFKFKFYNVSEAGYSSVKSTKIGIDLIQLDPADGAH
jgi:hypothetical protein